MECIEISEYIMKYLDKEISPEQESILHKHIENCEDCRIELETLTGIFDALDGVGLEEPPVGFEARVMSSVRKEAKMKSRLKGCAIGISVLLIILSVWAGIAVLVLYTPAAGITEKLIGNAAGALGWLWYMMLSGFSRFLMLGKALDTIESAVFGAYGLLILAASLLIFTVLWTYYYVSRLNRGYKI